MKSNHECTENQINFTKPLDVWKNYDIINFSAKIDLTVEMHNTQLEGGWVKGYVKCDRKRKRDVRFGFAQIQTKLCESWDSAGNP